MDGIRMQLDALFGLSVDSQDLTVLQTSARTVVIFLVGIALVRIGKKRFLGKSTALDALLAVMLGSVLGRAINGSAAFGPTIVACALMMGMHWLFSALAYRSRFFDNLLKGHPRTLVKDGELQLKAMKRAHVNENDLKEDIRLKARGAEIEDIHRAYLERSGDVSFVPSKKCTGPEVVEVKVEDGVQTMRIRFDH